MPYDDVEMRKQAATMGMTVVYLGILRKGSAWTPDETPEVLALQSAHLANIRSMSEAGKLVLVGPLLDGGELRGIYVFKTDSLAEAETLANSDPSVQAKRLVFDIHPWMIAKDML